MSIEDTQALHDLLSSIVVVTFLLVGVALPMILYARNKSRGRAKSAVAQAGTQELWETARRMETRIGYLETVLDTEVPGWRSRSEAR